MTTAAKTRKVSRVKPTASRDEALMVAANPDLATWPAYLDALDRLGALVGEEEYLARIRHHGAWRIDDGKDDWRVRAVVRAVREVEKAIGRELPWEQARVISMACTARIWALIG